MLARDVMVSPVISVDINATVRNVAKVLLDNHISAVPVLDGKGRIVGIVSESDLMHRTEAGTEHRRSWWLEIFQSVVCLRSPTQLPFSRTAYQQGSCCQ